MGATIEAVKLVMAAILSTKPWLRDPNVVRMPWREDIVTSILSRASQQCPASKEQPLKIGIFWSDGVVTPQPPIRRGLSIVHNVLESMGHKVRPYRSICKLRVIDAIDLVPIKVVDWNPPSQTTAKRVHVCSPT